MSRACAGAGAWRKSDVGEGVVRDGAFGRHFDTDARNGGTVGDNECHDGGGHDDDNVDNNYDTTTSNANI